MEPEPATEPAQSPKPSDRTLRLALRSAVVVLLTGVGLSIPGLSHADEVRNRQWHLDFLRIAKAHQITRGEGVTVAVVDSGVDYRHPDLRGALLPGRNFSSGRRDGWEDPTGHGTAMASLIAGRGHGADHRAGVLGVAPGVRVLPVRVKGAGPVSSARALEQGIEWAADHHADVVSISLTDVADPEVAEAVRYAQHKGSLVVAGVGNTANGDREVMWPARHPGVVAVSGTDRDGYFTGASVSGSQVVLSAPAVDIIAGGSGERGRYAVGTGTSNSTAIVAGAAALLKARYPELDAANLINRLIATADDRGPDGRDPRYGYGIVDPLAALTEDVPTVAANPLVTPVVTRSGSRGGRTAAKDTAARDGGINPAGWGLIALSALGVLALTGFVLSARARSRRRRVLGPSGSAAPGQIRSPVPPPR